MLLFIAMSSQAQQKDDYTKLPSGLAYKIVKDEPGPVAKIGDIATIHITVKLGDSVVYNSKTMNNNKPIPQPITVSKTAADLMEGFVKLSKGDQAIFKASTDVAFPNGAQKPPFVKDGDFLFWEIDMVDLKTKAQIEAEKKAAMAGEIESLKKYIQDNKIKATKSETGTYVSIMKQGKGAECKKGQLVKMKYTGYLLDGTTFDSNVDPKFQHTEPFEFPLGQGRVISGWDNSILGMRVGTKAKLLIPSANAYGSRAMPGNKANPKGIPANSTLVFDIEVLEARDNAPAPRK